MVQRCWHYNVINHTSTSVCQGPFEKCAQIVDCKPEARGNMACFALAELVINQTGRPDVTKKIVTAAGCYENLGAPDCALECLGSRRPHIDRYYCCCSSETCNNEIILPKVDQTLVIPKPIQNSTVTAASTSNANSSYILPVILLILTALVASTIIALYLRRKRSKRSNVHRHELDVIRSTPETLTPFRNSLSKDHYEDNATRLENNARTANNNVIDLKYIQLMDVVGSGKFGTVHKALLLPQPPTTDETVTTGDISKDRTDEIAVKIISNNELQSWQNELNIFMSPSIGHENIIRFFGQTENIETNSHWLLVEYAEHGSLHHYLRDNIVSWPELISIALGIVRGLSHLHDNDIAHRDFKSKNVLLRHNLSPAITDFGVAAILDISSSGSHYEHQRKYLQVGTPRYMAPEVLECAVTISKTSFAKIDVYALSLVLWELLSRCHPPPKPWDGDHDLDESASSCTSTNHQQSPVPVYKMPFEDEVGPNPDIDTMRHAIMGEKLRPPIRSEWRFYPVSKVAQAIVDGWEYDQDARISSSCIVERFESLKQQQEQMFQLRRAQLATNQTNPVTDNLNQERRRMQLEPASGPPELSVTAIVT